MNNLIKNKFPLAMLLIMGIFITVNVMAQTPDQRFSYQGELVDNGIPANGNYDITVSPFFSSTGGTIQGMASEHLNVTVTNGLFSLNNVDVVDPVGTDPFDGLSLFLEIGVRLAGSGAYTALAPRQQIHSVPYADNITRKGAITGQVLSFNGQTWEPADATAESPWAASGSDISYVSGMVGIGTSNPNGASLHISASGTDDAIRVQVNGGTKLYVRNDGGVAIGGTTSNVAPPDGLSVDGDTKQPVASNGIMKYMVFATCSNTVGSIIRSYNGINNSAITIAAGTGDVQCVIDFPSNINTRYWQVSPVIGIRDRGAHCTLSGTDKLNCYRYTTSTGANNAGNIMVLVY